MKALLSALFLAALAAVALAQDPNGNRMNRSFPEGATAATAPALSPTANRMNVVYAEKGPVEFSGGPSPFRNRLNHEWPGAPKAAPAKIEQPAVDPGPSP